VIRRPSWGIVSVGMATRPIKLAILLSGGGTTLKNIVDRISKGSLYAQAVCVIASHESARDKALRKVLDIDVKLLARRDHQTDGEFDVSGYSGAVFQMIRESGAELVCLCGFLTQLVIPDDFAGRVINIHPALLPSFGGHGMYGHHVHEAVLAAGCKVSGCTVHYADQTYDTGPIIVQMTCPVEEDDDVDSLAARVFELECHAYPQAIQLIGQGHVQVVDGRTYITPTP